MTWRRVGVALALTVLPAMAAPELAAARSSEERRRDEITAEVQRLRRQIDEAAAQEARLLAELGVTRRSKAALDARVAELDDQLAAARAEVVTARIEHQRAVAAHQSARRRLTRAQAELRAARDVLQQQAVTAFISFGQPSGAPFEVLVEVRDLRELHAASAMVDSVAGHQAATVARHDALRQDIERLEAETDRARSTAAARQEAVTARQAAIEAMRAEQAAARAEAAAEVAREEQLLASASTSRRSYESRVASLQRESDQIATLLRRRQEAARRQDGSQTAPAGRGVLGYPVPNPVITSGYGYRTHPVFGGRRLHAGVDFRAATGTVVRSAGAGTVVYAGTKGGYGNAVVVDHGGSLATLYGHLSRISVRQGATLARGETLGAAGSTGYSTGPHLHFEVRVNGTPVDPLNYL